MKILINILALAVAAGLAIYFTRKKSKEDKAYFGELSEPSASDKRIMAAYKKSYKPIPQDNRFATIEKDGWQLEDITFNATQFVYSNPLPTAAQKAELKTGRLVKLNFVDREGEVERMWVEVSGKEGELFKGILRNDSYGSDSLIDGKEIWFHANHIMQIGEREE